jgi:uncharacterized OsmC-like protein
VSERIIVRQNKDNQIGFWAVDPNGPDSEEYHPVHALYELTPYGLMLVSLASCTAQVVFSYAQYHEVALDEVELHMAYERVYGKDCDDCENIDQYEEEIHERIKFGGEKLSDAEKEKLFRIAHQCPIDKMFRHGIEIRSELDQE